MKIPEVLYHATHKDNIDSIWMYGLHVGSQGLTYFADSINGAAAFLVVRGMKLEDVMVFEIEASDLDQKLIDYGSDHNTNFFKGIEVYTYPTDIDPMCINNLYELFYKTEEQ